MDNNLTVINKYANKLSWDAQNLANKIKELNIEFAQTSPELDLILHSLTIFMLASFISYYIVSKVSSLLHTPLLVLISSISAITIVAAIAIVAVDDFEFAQLSGYVALLLASIGIFGGFTILARLLVLFKAKNNG